MTQNRDAVSRLCPACGLCCNGMLFGDVELQPDDNIRRLSRLGVELFRKGRKTAFPQPCACFDGKLCGIYADRPRQCRAFECGLLKRVGTGDLNAGAALKIIAGTRRSAETVLKLVRKLGNQAEAQPLNQRYAEVIAQPIDMSADKAVVKRRSELLKAVAKLAATLERDFMT